MNKCASTVLSLVLDERELLCKMNILQEWGGVVLIVNDITIQESVGEPIQTPSHSFSNYFLA